MSYETVLLSHEGGIATVTLNRPEIMNGLNATMRREIRAGRDRGEHGSTGHRADRGGARLLFRAGSR
jgi:enoyl-CoA hydratase/carnithine racemase